MASERGAATTLSAMMARRHPPRSITGNGSPSLGYFARSTGVVLVVGLALAGCAAWLTGMRNHQITRARYEQVSDQAVSAIAERMALYEMALRGVRGAIAAVGVDVVTSEDFNRYTETRDIDDEFPGMRGYGFIRRVARNEGAPSAGWTPADGALEAALRPSSPPDGDRYIIAFVAPVARNAAALGLDVASETHRRIAAETAMETGRSTLSAPITLVQTSGLEGRGFLLFLPIFRPNAKADTPDARRAEAVGWAYAPLVIDEILAGVNLAHGNLDLSIRDKASGNVEFFASKVPTETVAGFSQARELLVYGREWVVATRAKPALVAELGLTDPFHVGLAIAALTGLLSTFTAMNASGRRLQQAAAAENYRLAAIVASAQDAIIGKTLDGVITDFNPAAERLIGYSAAEAVGKRAAELMIPADLRAEEQWCLLRAGRGEPTPPHSSWRRKRDGSQFPVQVSVAPIRSQEGRVIGVATVIRDTTEQVAADARIQALNVSLEGQVAERTAALRAGSALQRAVIANAGYSVIATDLNGTVTLFNPAAERMLGYTAEEVVGRMTPATFHDPDEIALRAERLAAELGRPIEPGIELFVARPRLGRPEIGEWTYVTKSGERLPVLLNVSLLRSDDGQDLGYLGIAIDQSERYRHQAEMRAAEAGTWSYDVATGRVHFSAECARQHGLPDQEIEIDVEREWRPLAHSDDVPHVLRDLAHAVEHGGSYSTEFRVPLPDGGIRWINARGRVETDAAGRTVRVIGLTLDTTARKEAEIALSEAKAEAERANRAKTDFLASMSHEIRTPLNAVIGFTDLMLASGRLDFNMRRQANLVRSSGSALLTVVNDILDFSRVEAGAIELNQRPFALQNVLGNCIAIVRGSADAKGLDLRLEVDPRVPPWVLGDENRLRQVLLNLLNNAVKFTPAGHVTLHVAPGDDPSGPEIKFDVTDTGIGIPPDKLSRLFQRFSQVDGSIQRDFGGTGLGLAICRGLVELMGGRVEVSSEVGVGSCFSVTVHMPPTDAPRDGSALPPTRQGRRGRILLVDDSAVNRELAEAVLARDGHTVETAVDGEAAVKAVGEGGYDLVLLDIQMPGMDGMTAARLIRALKSPAAAVPILALTANVLPEHIEAYRAAGMDGHVGKPFDHRDLLATVGRLLPDHTAEAVIHPGLDETMFLSSRRVLPPPRLNQILNILIAELQTSFVGDVYNAAIRAEQRRRAHTLCSSTAMIGFTSLSLTCREIEAFDEAKVAREGLQAYSAKLDEARTLARQAESTVRRLIAEIELDPCGQAAAGG